MDNQNISVFSVCGWFCIPVKEHNAVIIKLSCKRPPFMSDEIIESPVYSFPVKEIPNIISALQKFMKNTVDYFIRQRVLCFHHSS
ncbi:hypothetical protein O5706_27635 [Escherichia coli]|nr:hypothetical protein [Escherichia coli]MCZ5350799.1 hypothetical protein [Escherichia coli]MCZ6087819.1 hypothetical protein [Escherichia coli]